MNNIFCTSLRLTQPGREVDVCAQVWDHLQNTAA